MVCFGITRPLQVLWVGAAALGSWSDENTVKLQAIFQIAVATIVMALQVMTLKIHYGVWKRLCARKHAIENINITVPSGDNDSGPEKKEERREEHCMIYDLNGTHNSLPYITN